MSYTVYAFSVTLSTFNSVNKKMQRFDEASDAPKSNNFLVFDVFPSNRKFAGHKCCVALKLSTNSALLKKIWYNVV